MTAALEREEVILVDEDDRPLGVAPKLAAHRQGQLHRALSVQLQDRHGRLLLQKRHIGKYHSGGLWTNTCCGHPRPSETAIDAAHRRLKEEMGISCPLLPLFSARYRAELDKA
jgi:isopentenyl-diphosphate delta-isomerase